MGGKHKLPFDSHSSAFHYNPNSSGSWFLSMIPFLLRIITDREFQVSYDPRSYERSLCNCLCRSLKNSGHSLLGFTSAVQYLKYFIYNFTFIPHGLLRTHKWPFPNVSGFIAQFVKASHRYPDVTGSNPVEILNFPGFYILNCRNSCEDHSLLDFTSAVQYIKCFTYLQVNLFCRQQVR